MFHRRRPPPKHPETVLPSHNDETPLFYAHLKKKRMRTVTSTTRRFGLISLLLLLSMSMAMFSTNPSPLVVPSEKEVRVEEVAVATEETIIRTNTGESEAKEATPAKTEATPDQEQPKAGTDADDEVSTSLVVPKNETIAVFYNVFTKSKDDVAFVKNIVEEQLSYRRPQHKVFVRSVGTSFEIEDAIRVRHDEEGDEPETLHLVWQYCRDHPTDKVAYIHSKGSFHHSVANDKLRRFLTRGALSEECENLPSMCNVCSSRMSPIPHPHTSGNMWLARCDYIGKLIDPLKFAVKMNEVELSAEWDSPRPENQFPCAGKERFAAEHWVHSHPTVMPCDLSTDDYFWNYDNIPEEDFEIDLQPAPRFDLKWYDVEDNLCEEYGFSEEDRLKEYQILYGESAPESWWGWKSYSTYKAQLTEKKMRKLLWFGEAIETGEGSGGEGSAKIDTLEIAIAYCRENLYWIRPAILRKVQKIGITKVKMTILSKCGKEEDVPNFANNPLVSEVNIVALPNVGGCDYAYAHFMKDYISRHTIEDASSSVIVFIKDTPRTKKNFHFGYHGGYRSVDDMVKIAASGKFICGITPMCKFSPYHDVESLNHFIMSNYTRIAEQNRGEKEEITDDFNVYRYKNLRDFHNRALNWTFQDELMTPVCYGGTFALPASRLIALSNQSDGNRIVARLVDILSRESKTGTTVEEHFVERTWAGLFSIPLTEDKTMKLFDISRGSGRRLRFRRFMDTGIFGMVEAEKSQC